MIKIALLGYGTVGEGVYEILNEYNTIPVEIKKVLVQDINKVREPKSVQNLLTDDFLQINNDSEIDIVIEVMGGLEKTYEYHKELMKSGKHIITANKAVVSKYYYELQNLAEKYNVQYRYEASVGGALPILASLHSQKTKNKITAIKGILNGTSNAILTLMSEGKSFDHALQQCQDKGYAEADPTDDLEGYDALRKLIILSNIAYNIEVNETMVPCIGIQNIIEEDIQYLQQFNQDIKLVAQSTFKDGLFQGTVEPIVVSKAQRFGTIRDAENLILITGNNCGTLEWVGQGAGKLPTANAILDDLVSIINTETRNVPNTPQDFKIEHETRHHYYVRIAKNTYKFYEHLDKRNLLISKDYVQFITQDAILSLTLDQVLFKARIDL